MSKIIDLLKEFGLSTNSARAYIALLKKNPVTGVGVKMFRYECANVQYARGNFNCTTHPHHTHLQILSETGIIGY